MSVAKDLDNAEPRRDVVFRSPKLLWGIVSFACGIGLWWLATASGVSVLPTPLTVFQRMIELAISGQLWLDMFASLRRVLIGFLIGSLIAVPVGFLMGWYKIARAVIDPWIQFFRVIPPLAIIPLAIVTLGIDEKPKIFVIFLAAFLSSVVSTYQGVISVDRTYINAARVLGAGGRLGGLCTWHRCCAGLGRSACGRHHDDRGLLHHRRCCGQHHVSCVVCWCG